MNDTIFSHCGDKILRASWAEATSVGRTKEGSAKDVGGGRDEALVKGERSLDYARDDTG